MNIHNLAYIILITIVPWIELRGSIPAGIALGENPLLVFALATIVNILMIFPIFLFLNLVFPFVENNHRIQPFLLSVRARAGKYVDKYGFLGLALFVAVPLPGTGAYSGALAAYLLGIKKRRAIPAIALGVLTAGIIIAAISTGALALLLNYV